MSAIEGCAVALALAYVVLAIYQQRICWIAAFASSAASSRPSLRDAGMVSFGVMPLASRNLAALSQLVHPFRK